MCVSNLLPCAEARGRENVFIRKDLSLAFMASHHITYGQFTSLDYFAPYWHKESQGPRIFMEDIWDSEVSAIYFLGPSLKISQCC